MSQEKYTRDELILKQEVFHNMNKKLPLKIMHNELFLRGDVPRSYAASLFVLIYNEIKSGKAIDYKKIFDEIRVYKFRDYDNKKDDNAIAAPSSDLIYASLEKFFLLLTLNPVKDLDQTKMFEILEKIISENLEHLKINQEVPKSVQEVMVELLKRDVLTGTPSLYRYKGFGAFFTKNIEISEDWNVLSNAVFGLLPFLQMEEGKYKDRAFSCVCNFLAVMYERPNLFSEEKEAIKGSINDIINCFRKCDSDYRKAEFVSRMLSYDNIDLEMVKHCYTAILQSCSGYAHARLNSWFNDCVKYGENLNEGDPYEIKKMGSSNIVIQGEEFKSDVATFIFALRQVATNKDKNSFCSNDTISQIKSTKDSGADESFKNEGERAYGFVRDRDRASKKDEGSFKNGNWYDTFAYMGATTVKEFMVFLFLLQEVGNIANDVSKGRFANHQFSRQEVELIQSKLPFKPGKIKPNKFKPGKLKENDNLLIDNMTVPEKLLANIRNAVFYKINFISDKENTLSITKKLAYIAGCIMEDQKCQEFVSDIIDAAADGVTFAGHNVKSLIRNKMDDNEFFYRVINCWLKSKAYELKNKEDTKKFPYYLEKTQTAISEQASKTFSSSSTVLGKKNEENQDRLVNAKHEFLEKPQQNLVTGMSNIIELMKEKCLKIPPLNPGAAAGGCFLIADLKAKHFVIGQVGDGNAIIIIMNSKNKKLGLHYLAPIHSVSNEFEKLRLLLDGNKVKGGRTRAGYSNARRFGNFSTAAGLGSEISSPDIIDYRYNNVEGEEIMIALTTDGVSAFASLQEIEAALNFIVFNNKLVIDSKKFTNAEEIYKTCAELKTLYNEGKVSLDAIIVVIAECFRSLDDISVTVVNLTKAGKQEKNNYKDVFVSAGAIDGCGGTEIAEALQESFPIYVEEEFICKTKTRFKSSFVTSTISSTSSSVESNRKLQTSSSSKEEIEEVVKNENQGEFEQTEDIASIVNKDFEKLSEDDKELIATLTQSIFEFPESANMLLGDDKTPEEIEEIKNKLVDKALLIRMAELKPEKPTPKVATSPVTVKAKVEKNKNQGEFEQTEDIAPKVTTSPVTVKAKVEKNKNQAEFEQTEDIASIVNKDFEKLTKEDKELIIELKEQWDDYPSSINMLGNNKTPEEIEEIKNKLVDKARLIKQAKLEPKKPIPKVTTSMPSSPVESKTKLQKIDDKIKTLEGKKKTSVLKLSPTQLKNLEAQKSENIVTSEVSSSKNLPITVNEGSIGPKLGNIHS